MNDIRGAIIGCGIIAKNAHLPAFASIENADIVAVIDTDIKSAKKLSNLFNINEFYSTHSEIIDRNDIDFVCITTPPQFHAEIAIEMLKAGKHVLIEKPMTLTLDEAIKVKETSQQYRKIAGVVHNRRFFSTVQRAKNAIKEGRLGDIYHANFISHLPGPSIGYPASNWHFEVKKSGGGVLMDQGTHTFDLVRYLLGEIASVYSVDSTIFQEMNTDTSVQSIIECEEITKCMVELSWTCDFTECPITLWGSAGTIFIEPMFGYYEEIHEPRNPVKRLINMERTLIRFATSFATHKLENTHKKLIANFLSSISRNKKPLVTVEDGLKSIEIVQAAYQSIKTRSIIDL